MAAETKRTHTCVCAWVCAHEHQGLRKIIAIDLRRRNVETLPDGTFSYEWLQMRRDILERPGQRDAAKTHQNYSRCLDLPSGWIHNSPSNSEVAEVDTREWRFLYVYMIWSHQLFYCCWTFLNSNCKQQNIIAKESKKTGRLCHVTVSH